jgi:hypothetical protein
MDSHYRWLLRGHNDIRPQRVFGVFQLLSISNVISQPGLPDRGTRLQLMAMGIKDVHRFYFMDAPSLETIDAALETLVLLGAVERRGTDAKSPLPVR